MTGLADELASIGPAASSRCRFAVWIASLPDDDAAVVRAAVMDPTKPMRQVAKVVTRNGYHLGESIVQNHRSGGCRTCDWCWPK